jgi:hypothetical protein
MALYEVKSFEGGISSFADRGTRGAFKFGSNLDIRKDVDTLSCGQAMKEEGLFGSSHSTSSSISQSTSQSPSGSESPSRSYSNSQSASASPSGSASKSSSSSASPSGSPSPSSSGSASPSPSAGLNNVYEDLVIVWVKCSDGNTYGFGDGGHIYRRYSDGFTRMVYTDADGEIFGAVEKPSSGGKTYLQWATGTSIKRKEIPGAGDWSDVTEIADNLTDGVPHTMKQVGGSNMICNGSLVAMVGYDDSYTNEALKLPGDVSKALVERNGRLVAGTYKVGYPNKGVNAMIDCEVPLCQRGDDGELFYADFTNTIPVKRFPGGGIVNPGGVANQVEQVNIYDWEQTAQSWIDKQTIGNMSLWGVYNATTGKNGIYTYGRKNKEAPFTLNLEYTMDVDEIGAVECVDGVIIASYRDGSDYGVRAVDSTTKATGIWEGLEFRSPIKKAEEITTYKLVEVFTEALPSGTSIEFYYKMNKTDSWIQAKTVDGQTSYSSTGGKKATFRIGEEVDVYEPRLILNPTGNISPEVLRMRTYFD